MHKRSILAFVLIAAVLPIAAFNAAPQADEAEPSARTSRRRSRPTRSTAPTRPSRPPSRSPFGHPPLSVDLNPFLPRGLPHGFPRDTRVVTW